MSEAQTTLLKDPEVRFYLPNSLSAHSGPGAQLALGLLPRCLICTEVSQFLMGSVLTQIRFAFWKDHPDSGFENEGWVGDWAGSVGGNTSSWGRKWAPGIASLHIRKLEEKWLSAQFNMKSQEEKGLCLFSFAHVIHCPDLSLIETFYLSIMVAFNSYQNFIFRSTSIIFRSCLAIQIKI